MKLGLTTTSRSVPPQAPQVPLAKATTAGTLPEPELPESKTTLVQNEAVPRSKRQRRSLAAPAKTGDDDETAESSAPKRRGRSAK